MKCQHLTLGDWDPKKCQHLKLKIAGQANLPQHSGRIRLERRVESGVGLHFLLERE
jgi:hypothetical protein